jgi:hypothetical protein
MSFSGRFPGSDGTYDPVHASLVVLSGQQPDSVWYAHAVSLAGCALSLAVAATAFASFPLL